MRKPMLAAALLALMSGTPAIASEDDSCTRTPKDQWMSMDSLKAKLIENGYAVEKIETEGSCVEAKVKDKEGRAAELYLDPASGSIVDREDD